MTYPVPDSDQSEQTDDTEANPKLQGLGEVMCGPASNAQEVQGIWEGRILSLRLIFSYPISTPLLASTWFE